ncbi:hypothetical protein FQN50_008938 [Emmonsiellopsis sp. PD_5]|nr:hypothetical protein FQN50_008938 [Emmonsiellopsis sp. PD_5]
MLASPPKRRRSNSSSAIPISASNTSQSRPQPPLSPDKPSHRASFRSPTRSSLARSHPDVLRNVLGRSPAKVAQPRPVSRGRESSGISGIRGSIPLRPSLAARETGETSPLPGGSRRGSSVPVFVAPPRRTSERGRASFSPGLAPEGRAGAGIADTRDDGVSRLRLGAGRGAGRPDDDARSSSSSEQENGEPELPPTPTELGRERAPNRQRGLLSSSPSWRQEKKRKQRLRDGLKPSPLKPKEGEDAGNEQDIEPTRARLDEEIPPEKQEKQKLRDALAAQLALLKEDIAQLEDAAQRYERPDEYPEPNEEAINNLIELLTTSNPSCAPPPPPPPAPPTISSLLSFLLPFASDRFIPQIDTAPPPSPPPENPFALEQPADLMPYLTLFAPLSLTAHTSTSSSLTQTHTLTFTPPPPFPSHLFQIPITFQTDPEKQAVLSISIPPQLKPTTDKEQTHTIPPPLHTWLTTRLSNPLLNHDISSLCWGISRYWEADIARAKLWVRLEELRSRITPSQHPQPPKKDQSKDGKYTPRALLPHLGRTSLLFSTNTNTTTNTNPVASSGSVDLLITYPLVLDLWTSEPHFAPDVSVRVSDGAARKVEREAKRVFGGFLIGGVGKGGGNGNGSGNGNVDVPVDADPEVLVRAVEGVVGVVFGEG